MGWAGFYNLRRGYTMQIRATVSPSELQEAARMSRPRYFWLRFFAANWYSTVICLLVIGVAVDALINHKHPKWGAMAIFFAVFSSLIGLSWYRWNANLSKSAGRVSALSGTLSLDNDGIRTILASGASTFVPWSSYSKWTEGKSIFLLAGRDGSAILPIDDGYRDTIRSLLVSKVT
jgi:hypothetical protein